MKILADLHHYELYYSLQLLFGKRLGFELFRPIGLDWYEQGYWNVYPHPDTARQYLGLDHSHKQPKDVHGNLLPNSSCVNLKYHIEDGVYYAADSTKPGVVQKAITFDRFKEMKFDILLSSIPQHIGPYNKLIELYQPQAKHIFQVGNAWGRLPGIKNILASTAPFSVSSDINICFYHQEFDLEIFKYEPPTIHDKVYSYIHYMHRVDLMKQLASLLPEWKFKTHGAGMDLNIALTKDLAQTIIDSAFTWHYKPEGDGFGHVLANTYACGRPPLIWAPFYKGKLGEAFLEDIITCIDISRRSIEETAKILQACSRPDIHEKMCENVYKRFKDVVNYEEEEIRIRKFIENLI